MRTLTNEAFSIRLGIRFDRSSQEDSFCLRLLIQCIIYIDGICDHFNLSIQSLQQHIRPNLKTQRPLKYSEMSRDTKQKLCDAI